MTLKELINLIFEKYDYYPYLLRIMPYITKKLNLKQINDINKKIIDSEKNTANYEDYFSGKSINKFIEEVKKASYELRTAKKHITTEQQHLIISFIDNYVSQLRVLKKNGILNFVE